MQKRWLNVPAVTAVIFLTAGGCASEETEKNEEMTLEAYLLAGEEEWFMTGRKEYPVQAMMVSEEKSFHNVLENTDYTVGDDGITVILKGSEGEMWTSKLANVVSSYVRADRSALSEEDFAEKDVYIDLLSIPSPDSYYAMFVPARITLTLETAQGDILHANLPESGHGEGDYLVCRIGKNGKPDLSDIWVVNGLLFKNRFDEK